MTISFDFWQFWNGAKQTLSESGVCAIWGRRNARLIRWYCQNPAYSEDRPRDPLERLFLLFKELVIMGRADLVKMVLKRLSMALDEKLAHELFELDDIKPTINQEILCDYRAISELQDAIEDGESPETVRIYAEKAKAEIDRTLAKYLQEQGGQR